MKIVDYDKQVDLLLEMFEIRDRGGDEKYREGVKQLLILKDSIRFDRVQIEKVAQEYLMDLSNETREKGLRLLQVVEARMLQAVLQAQKLGLPLE